MSEVTYTQEQFDAILQKEADKRVTDALGTAKTKWEEQKKLDMESERTNLKTELEANAKLSAEELAKKEFEDKMGELTQKEISIKRKENLLQAYDEFSKAEIPKSHYEKLVGMMVSEDENATLTNVKNFIETFNVTKTDIETKIKTEMSKINSPDKGGNESTTKAEFDKMRYSEKVKFKTEHPDAYKGFMG